MKPLNYDDNGCNNISSNCVIWQGPNIPCINLCKGDTISEVVYKLATELCDILTTLNLTSYDFSCFNFTSGVPQNFQDLIQVLITQVCEVNGKVDAIGTSSTARLGTTTTTETFVTGTGTNCPDCVIPMADCFHYVNGFGDDVTSAQLLDYVTAIGNKICALVVEISSLTLIVNDNTTRIEALENAPAPVYIPPTVTPACVLPSIPQEMDVVLAALEAQFCTLRIATGTSPELIANVSKQCVDLNNAELLAGTGGTLGSLPGWSVIVTNLAQSIGNMWLTVCDMRTAIRNIQLNCCPSGCDGIEVGMTAVLDTNSVRVYITGTLPAGFADCLSGNNIKVTDSSGNSVTVPINVTAYLNFPTGFVINLSSTSVNTTLDLTVDLEPCFFNSSTNATCKSCLSYVIKNLGACPTISFFNLINAINYSYTTGTGNYTYTVELWDSTFSSILQTNINVITGPTTINGSFAGLTPNTTYNIRIVVSPTSCPECLPTECAFNTITTLPIPCPPALNIATGFEPIIIL